MSSLAFAEDGALTGERILLVEDQDEYRDLMRQVFERAGATVADADTAAEALTLLDTVRPTIIVSDIGLPGMDGYSFMRAVRAKNESLAAHAYAVAVTSHVAPEDRAAAFDAGFDAHMGKPFDCTRLLEVVSTVHAKRPRDPQRMQ